MKKLCWVSIIGLLFMSGEFVGGYLSNSTAIMSDAAHMLSDFLGFAISMLSIIISKRAPTQSLSYGFLRAEVLGALVSVV
jgi:zinc transporter 2